VPPFPLMKAICLMTPGGCSQPERDRPAR
jgi:hypothetical protein